MKPAPGLSSLPAGSSRSPRASPAPTSISCAVAPATSQCLEGVEQFLLADRQGVPDRGLELITQCLALVPKVLQRERCVSDRGRIGALLDEGTQRLPCGPCLFVQQLLRLLVCLGRGPDGFDLSFVQSENFL